MLQNLLKLLSSSSAPAVSAGLVYAAFEFAEKIASKEAKDALTAQIKTINVREAAIIPAGTEYLFDYMFGQNHFSAKCIFRSIIFSIFAIALMTVIQRLMFSGAVGLLHVLPVGFDRTYYEAWIPISLLPDYLNLYKTRVIMNFLQKNERTPTWALFLILVADFILGIIIFLSIARLVFPAVVLETMLSPRPSSQMGWYLNYIEQTWIYIFSPDVWLGYFTFKDNDSPLLYAGLLASAWLWMYIFALVIARGISRSERILNWVRWFLDINEHPFRSVGAIAAALTFVATAALLGLAQIL